MKAYIVKPHYDLFSLEEIEYQTHEEFYEKTKDIPAKLIFQESEIDLAIKKLVDLNSI